jgi:hypothetical protein
MTPNATDAIRRHADGSIDTGFYLARGRAERSRQAHHLIGALGRLVRRLWPHPLRLPHVPSPSEGLRHGTRPGLG